MSAKSGLRRLSPESQAVIDRVLERLKVCDKCPDFDPDGMFSPLEHRIMVLDDQVAELQKENDGIDVATKDQFRAVVSAYEDMKARAEAVEKDKDTAKQNCRDWIDKATELQLGKEAAEKENQRLKELIVKYNNEVVEYEDKMESALAEARKLIEKWRIDDKAEKYQEQAEQCADELEAVVGVGVAGKEEDE